MASKSFLWNVCTIIQTQLGLANGQVMIYNQKKLIPPTTGLWITVGIVTCKPFGMGTKVSGTVEHQSINMQALVSIDIMSRDDEALNRKEEVIMSLSSTFAEQIQEQYSFKIGKIPPTPLVNLGDVEGAAIPFRFNLTVQMQYMVSRSQSVPYYDQFDHSEIVES